MTTVYLVRHAEAEGNLFKRIHGQYDSPVTALGRRQIECLEKRFSSISVDAVYASDLKRTCQTAAAIYVPKQLELHKEPKLREIYLGAWEDKPFGEVMRTDLEDMLRFSTGEPDWRAPGGESLREVGDRAEQAIRRIIRENPGRTVAVVSHGTALRQVLSRLLHRPVDPDQYLPEGYNTAVSCLEAEGDDITVKWYNDASHLTPDILNAAVKPNQGRDNMADEGARFPHLLWFRPWDPKREAERYLAYRAEGWLSSHGTMEHFDGPAFLAAAQAHSAYDSNAVQVVYSDDQPAGILELDYAKGIDEGVGAIAFYYVDEAHRKCGLGVQLLGQAVSVYRAMGRTKLRLRCAPENETAYHFYCRQDFKKVGMAEDSVVPLYLMDRPIL